MTKTMEEVELQFRSSRQNHPGYNYPLEFRPLKLTDSKLLTPVFKKHGKTIRGFLGTFHNAHNWQIADAQRFVSAEMNAEFPNFTWLFFIGRELVGMGSIHPYGESPLDVQIVLSVFGNHQGKGIGSAIGVTLKKLAFEVWGFSSFWWLVDATNRTSIRVAEKTGLSFHHSWEDQIKHAEMESGLWLAFHEQRPSRLPDGILQGQPLSYWQETRTSSLLQAVIKARGEDN